MSQSGSIILLVLAVLAWRGHFEQGNYMPVEITGLYRHFVSIVWVFLFPLLYLAGHR
ncbi:MAG: cytochrome c oxidase subunit 3 [Spartobacteria bacterium]